MDKEKVVLITGGAKRIGAYIARYFHAKGFNIILHFNSSAKEADQLKSDLLSIRKNSCRTIQANFLDESSIKSALKEIKPSSSKLTGTEIIEDLRKQRLKIIEIELRKHA